VRRYLAANVVADAGVDASHAAIVTDDRWHGLEGDEPADLLPVTVRRDTQLEKRASTVGQDRPHSDGVVDQRTEQRSRPRLAGTG
jgi:hypothetical protein